MPRGRQIGIAEAEVVNLVRPELLFQFNPLFEHSADHGRLRNGCLDFFGYRHNRFPAGSAITGLDESSKNCFLNIP
mgnify:CR=1 FL=1